ncbi:MAG: hypothetical protein ACYS6K_04020 [Planctomycetota bacterium]|jgi:hypothetical protein
MKRRENNVKARSLTIVLCIPGILLLAVPACWAQQTDFYDGGTYDVTSPVDHLNINIDASSVAGTTVNLYADISSYIAVGADSFLNIHSGNVGGSISVHSTAVVTVYGTGFGGSGDFSVAGQVTFSGGSGTLTGTYGDHTPINLSFSGSDILVVYLEDPVTSDEEVEIDIKPGSHPNSINLKSNGAVPVAVLSTDEFDAADVDPATVDFAGASPLRWTLCDVDDDGDEDMLFHFKTQELNLDENSTEAELTGQTNDGDDISGTDDVRIVPPKSKKK